MAKLILLATGLILPHVFEDIVKPHDLKIVVYERDLASCIAGTTCDALIVEWDRLSNKALTDICSYRLSGGSLPILVVSTRSGFAAHEAALNAGANEYMKLPFDSESIKFRITLMLHRKEYKLDTLVCGELKVDMDSRAAWVFGEKLPLGTNEFEILELFLSHPHNLFSAEKIQELLPEQNERSTFGIRRSIAKIKHRLDQIGSSVSILTVYGKGYRLSRNAPTVAALVGRSNIRK